jgi:hypothetical protein
MKAKAKNRKRSYRSLASRVAEASDPESKSWIALTGKNPDRTTPEFRIADIAMMMEWGDSIRAEYAPEAAAFVLRALQQRDAGAFRRLAEAMELVERYWAPFYVSGPTKNVDWLGHELAFLDRDGFPTVKEYQQTLKNRGVHVTDRALRDRIHAMGLPLAGRGAPKKRK